MQQEILGTKNQEFGEQADGPLVSVVIPTYNRAHCLGRAIRSVLSQTHRNLELIVADDASTDHTEAMVRAVPDSRVIYVRQETNQGASAARNLGLAHARGEYIAFQDSDDEWLLDKIEMQVASLEEAGPDFGATFGLKLIYGSDGRGGFGEGLVHCKPPLSAKVRSGDISEQLTVQNLISPQTLLARTDVVHATGAFDTRLPCNNDWDFMLRMAQRTQVLYTQRPVVLAYISSDSISRDKKGAALAFMIIMKKQREMFARNACNNSQKLFVIGQYLQMNAKYRSANKFMLRALRLYPWNLRQWMAFAYAMLTRIRRPHPA